MNIHEEQEKVQHHEDRLQSINKNRIPAQSLQDLETAVGIVGSCHLAERGTFRSEDDKKRKSEHQGEEEIIVHDPQRKFGLPDIKENLQPIVQEDRNGSTAEQGCPYKQQETPDRVSVDLPACGSTPEFIGQVCSQEISEKSQNGGPPERTESVRDQIPQSAGQRCNGPKKDT